MSYADPKKRREAYQRWALKQNPNYRPATWVNDAAPRVGMSRAEVAAALGISKESVRQTEERALAKLRRSGALKGWLAA